MTTRQPAVAGLFYPGDADRLAAVVDHYLAEARTNARAPKALIVPHAGYAYSGPVAASAYASLRTAADIIERVVLIGPSHRVAFSGLALCRAEAFATPLGCVALDKTAVAKISGFPQVRVLDAAHEAEHSLEVHLPFLQRVLKEFALVPLVVGEATPEEVAEVLDVLWGADETLLVVSSDLSHYHDYRTARTIDAVTSQAIERLDYKAIGPDRACGCRPLNGLLLAASRRGLAVSVADLRNSGDTAGDRSRVVGYGAYALRASSRR